MSFRVRVSEGVPEAGIQRLESVGLEVSVGGLDLHGVEALLCLLTDCIDEPVLAAGKQLRIVANMAAGTDNIDRVAAARRGIQVSNTPDILTDATADLAFALLLAAARRIPWADRLVRGGGFQGWEPQLGLGFELKGRTLGIIGAGRIGQAVAERARGFRMQPLFLRRRGGVSLEELLERSDFVSLHVPLTAQTHHLIGVAELRRMRPAAILVNTARGPVVDENALVQALREGQIAAAALDVFENEPVPAPGLCELPNVVLTPHVGSATTATRDRMAQMAAENVVAVSRGDPIPNPVRG